jgi:outer membrane protein OmpA-like peptidoglycan-associated protein
MDALIVALVAVPRPGCLSGVGDARPSWSVRQRRSPATILGWRDRGPMSRRFQVDAVGAAWLAAGIMFSCPVLAQELITTPDGRCVVSYGDRQPTVEEMKRALLGDDCIRTRGLRRDESAATSPTGATCPRGSSLALNIHFAFDSAVLTEEARRQLADVARVMGEFPTCRFVLEGHTDATGPEAYNLDLSNRRALAVEEHLMSLNVPPHVAAVGRGETTLLVPEEPNAGKNRRVEVLIDGDA